MSLGEMDEDRLKVLEAHINKNAHLVNELKCCFSAEYKKQTEFAFLPGHRSLILGIKGKIHLMKEARIQKQKSRMESRALRPKQPKKSAEELKISLIQSLNTFATKTGLPEGLITVNNIRDFTEQPEGEQIAYKCNFSCLFCSKLISTQYKNYWMTSNATKHIKDHYTKGYSATVENIEFNS